MAKKTGSKKSRQADKQDRAPAEVKSNAWIPYRTGIILIAILSIGMTALTVYQAVTESGMPFGQALLTGLFFGGMLWVIFFGFILLNRLLGRH